MIQVLVSTIASGLALGLSFLQPSLGACAFIAFALILPTAFKTSYKKAYTYAFFSGLVAFACANYWLYFFLNNLVSSSLKAFFLFIVYLIYSANIIGLLILGISWFYHRLPRWGYFLLTPLFACCVFSYYPLIFPFNLGVTQVGFSGMLQPIAFFSHWSLSAFVILINILLAEMLQISPGENLKKFTASLAVLCALFTLWFSLGLLSSSLARKAAAEKKPLLAGFHQPLNLNHLRSTEGKVRHTRSYSREIANSYALANAGASIIVWPESQPKDILKKAWVLDAYKQHAQAMSADLVLQELSRVNNKPEQYRNSSIFIDRFGKHAIHDKVVRIPFGEYLPAILNRGEFGKWLQGVFADVHNEVIPGEEAFVFEHNGIKILPQICYEFLDAQQVVATVKKNPDIQLIIAQSNDNWFFSQRQVHMHNAYAVLRAIETRTAVLHVVNGGPSFVINEFGELLKQSQYQQKGAFLTEIPVGAARDKTHILITPERFMLFSASSTIMGFILSLLPMLRRKIKTAAS